MFKLENAEKSLYNICIYNLFSSHLKGSVQVCVCNRELHIGGSSRTVANTHIKCVMSFAEF